MHGWWSPPGAGCRAGLMPEDAGFRAAGISGLRQDPGLAPLTSRRLPFAHPSFRGWRCCLLPSRRGKGRSAAMSAGWAFPDSYRFRWQEAVRTKGQMAHLHLRWADFCVLECLSEILNLKSMEPMQEAAQHCGPLLEL